MKKILVLTSTYPRWKADTVPPFVEKLSTKLAREYKIYVLAPHYPKSRTREMVNGVRIYRYRYFIASLERLAGSNGLLPVLKKNFLYWLLLPFMVLSLFFYTVYLVKKENIDVIHAHWILPQGLIAWLVSKLTNIPYVVTCHGGDVYSLQSSSFKALKKIILSNAYRVTGVSKAISGELRKLDSTLSPQVISMGVDCAEFSPEGPLSDAWNKNRFPKLLFIGRLAEKKGVNYLISAMRSVTEEYPKSQLIIVGGGPLDMSLRKNAKSLVESGHIIFLGAVENKALPPLLRTCDLFVAPSIQTEDGDQEGLPVTVMEAMATETVCIVGRVKGIEELICEGKNGFLCKQKSGPSIAEEICKALNSDRAVVAIEARKTIQKSRDWKIISEQFIEVLK